MKKISISLLLFAMLAIHAKAQSAEDAAVVKRLYDKELTDGRCYGWLDTLSNQIGGRLSGSPQAAKAVEWAQKLMQQQGFDKVFVQEVMVPHWFRGDKEVAKVTTTSPKKATRKVNVCALGGSIGTGSKGIKAEVVEVHNFDELKQLGKEKVQGKIVFFNRPFDPTLINTFAAYGGAVDQRGAGASEAAKLGAVAVVVRSMTDALDYYPHTGAMHYAPGITQIPAAAISTKDADELSAELNDTKVYSTSADGPKIQGNRRPVVYFYLKMNCATLDSVKSYNVIAQTNGSEHPERIISVGGHLDSWDTGDGADDDGSGVVQSLDALRILKLAGIRPKNTIRAVFFMNEENGLHGGTKYADLATKNHETHIAGIETDRGSFQPIAFSINRKGDTLTKMESWLPLFKPYGIWNIQHDDGGVDFLPLSWKGIPSLELIPEDQRYFDYHHSPLDTYDKVNKRELELGAGALASLIYLIDKYGL